MAFKQSDCFNKNFFFLKVFGLWPGKTDNKFYKYFSFAYLAITLVAYNVLLTLNLYYTPPKIEKIIHETIFFFTEIVISYKAFMILLKRKKLLALFELLDCNEFKGNDAIGTKIIDKYNTYYKIYFIIYLILGHSTCSSLVIFPVIGSLFSETTLDLPICKYYFLSDEIRNDYFTLLYLYQSIGIYGHMLYNVIIDCLIAGFLMLAIVQVKVLCHNLQNLKIEKTDTGDAEELDHKQSEKLHRCIEHYALILKYCEDFQDIFSATIFVQYGIGSAIFCVNMCGFLLESTVETIIFMVGYFFALNIEIFLPAWLGTQLNYESQELMVATYKSEWIPRSEGYKRSIRLLVERAKYPIVITGLKIFPLSLATYISIMRASYSCFTLVRFFKDRQEQ